MYAFLQTFQDCLCFITLLFYIFHDNLSLFMRFFSHGIIDGMFFYRPMSFCYEIVQQYVFHGPFAI